MQCKIEQNGEIVQFEVDISAIKQGTKYGLKKIKCPICGGEIWENARKCEHCGLEDIGGAVLDKEKKAMHAQQVVKKVKCPYCGSTQIQMVPRKWSIVTGFMTNKVDRVCMLCKKKF